MLQSAPVWKKKVHPEVNPIKKDKSEQPTNDFSESETVSPWAYASEGTQLAITLLLGFYAGYKLDQWRNASPWFTVAGSFCGIGIGLYNFLRRFLKK